MAVVITRPFSPNGQPFTGFFIFLNKSQERKTVEIKDGNPTVEPVELMPGSYNVEWIQAGKEPIFDALKVPDEAEVELKDICNSLKGEPVDKEVIQEAVGEPELAADAVTDSVSDPTVSSQAPSTEQEVSPEKVSTKRGGGASANA